MVHVTKFVTFGKLRMEASGQGRLAIASSQETRRHLAEMSAKPSNYCIDRFEFTKEP